MLSTPADSPFFSDSTASSTSLRRVWWSSSVYLGTVQYWWISTGLVVVELRAVFCPSVRYLLLFCEAFSWAILDSSHFPLFHSGQVCHQLVCPLTDVLPQIFFSLTTLFSYSVFFSLFHAPLDVVVHVLVFLRSFRFKSFLSWFFLLLHRLRISAVTPFFFWQCLPRIWLAVSVTAVLKVVIIESMSVSSLLMMVRGANFPPIIVWKVSYTLGSFSFSRSNLSLVCFGLLSFFQVKAKGHHQQVVITSNVCSWKTLCSGTVHSWLEALPH